MEASDSDDDCQLYTRSAEHFIKKREEMQAKRRELEKIIDLIPEDEVENALNYGNLPNQPLVVEEEPSRPNCTPNPEVSLISIEETSNSDDDIPLAQLSRNLRRHGHKTRSKRTRRTCRKQNQKQHSTSQSRDLGVIVLDDDTGYAMDSFPPIDFSGRTRKKSRLSEEALGNISLENVINDDSEEDNSIESDDLVTLTIEWNNSVKTIRKEFKLRRYQKFESVFEELAMMENITTNRVLLMYDFKSVSPMDTPSSLNLKFYGALIGSVSATEINHSKPSNIENDGANVSGLKGDIQVKLLLQTKQTLLFGVMKNQKMDILYKKCAEELKCDRSKIKLTFDGEYVEPSDLVAELDVEDGDVFEVHLKA